MSQRNDDKRPPAGLSPLQFVGIGFELVVPLLMGLLGGRWLDRRFGTAPWLLLVGALLGGAAGVVDFIRRVVPPRNSGGGPS